MKEEWKPILGFEGYYMISNMGRVYSIKKDIYLAGDVSWSGHIRVTLFNKEKKIKKRWQIHRLVAIYFLNLPENYNKMVVNHLDSNPGNNCFLNLEWTTQQKNTIHAMENNKNWIVPIGRKNGQSKLDDVKASAAIEMWNNNIKQKDIAKKFNVTRATIAQITQGRQWKHLQHLNKRGVRK